jgi:hypothetical protein
MAIAASANLSVQIAGGPQFSVTWNIKADGYDRLTVVIPHDNASHNVQLQPGPGSQVLLLVITSTDYSGSLSCDLGGHAFVVNQPLAVSGSDIVTTLNNNPTTIAFKNAGAADITADLMVVRKAM